MDAGVAPSKQSGAEDDPQGAQDEIVVIANRSPTGSSSGGGGSASGRPAIIVNIGGINASNNGVFASLVEALRGLVTNVTDFDLDPSFTPKQREILTKAIRGLTEHPDYAAKMEALLAKGADINIVADYTGRFTNSNHGITVGKNDDGTVDCGESMTIYINMNFGGAPTTDASFANTIVHELLHTLGDPSLDALLDAPNSTYDRGPTRDIFSGYDYQAPAGSESAQASIISVPNGGGAAAGAGELAVYNGSDAADRITPGGGGLVFSGGGDDSIFLTLGTAATELVDSGGNDIIELPSGLSLADVSLRWSSDGSNLSVLVDDTTQLTVLNATGAGAVESISIGGLSYSLALLPQSTNHAPAPNENLSKVEGSFFGGYVGDGSASDFDGDFLSYKLETVSGEFADEMWRVDPRSGTVFGDFTRMAELGSAYSFVTISASDGIEITTSSLTIWWGSRNEVPEPLSSMPQFDQNDEPPMSGFLHVNTMPISGDNGMSYV